MQSDAKTISAIMAVFPNSNQLSSFLEDKANHGIFATIAEFAFRNGVVETAEWPALKALVQKHARSIDECTPPAGLNFGDLIEKKNELLRINMSIRALTDHINTFIADNLIELPRVDKSMLSRLKKEPADTNYKRNVIRSLAFWLGYQRAKLGPLWNYETLLKLCLEKKQEFHPKEGVRIGFALYSRGDTIDSDIVGWLKKKIMEYIDQSDRPTASSNWGKVRSYDVTTFYVDFPKESTSGGASSYRLSLMKGLSLAYQITISWALSKYSTKNRFLPIAIVAGDFAVADSHLLPMLTAKLPDDPVIRVSDFVHKCISISDIRVVLCRKPCESNLFNSETLNIWWVTGVYSHLYFDFIPELLKDPLLKKQKKSVDSLVTLLWFPPENGSTSTLEPNTISIFLDSPNNALLGIEIAKTLYYRKRLREANEVLRIVLSMHPNNLIARTFRVILLRSLAPEAPSFTEADYILREAVQEAEYALGNCDPLSEDFFCEYGNIYFSRAMLKIQHMRNKKRSNDFRKSQVLESINGYLDQAESLYEKGMIVSPIGIRSTYFLIMLRLIRGILRHNEHVLWDHTCRFSLNRPLVKQLYEKILWPIGIQPTPEDIDPMYYKRIKLHNDTISLDSYLCASYFCHAVSWWDVLSSPTVGMVKNALKALNAAIEFARNQEKNDIHIYSFNRIFSEIITPAEFIEQVEASINMIKKSIKGDISKRLDHEVIKLDPDTPLLLTFIFDRAQG